MTEQTEPKLRKRLMMNDTPEEIAAREATPQEVVAATQASLATGEVAVVGKPAKSVAAEKLERAEGFKMLDKLAAHAAPERQAARHQSVALAALVESPFNPRKNFGPLDELEQSIARLGVLQPPLVREVRVGPTHRLTFEIVFGHRRIRAAKNLGIATVQCEVRDLTDAEALEAQVVENVQREQLTWLEEADAYAQLQKIAGYSAQDIAGKVGKSLGWVYGRLKLLNLSPEARRAFTDGKVPGSVALALARVPHSLQGKALIEIAPKNAEPPTARRSLELLQRDFCRQLRRAPFDLKDDLLVMEAGACLKCPKNSRTTPELFGDFDRESVGGAAGICSDVVCYAAKVDAHAKAQQAALVKAGAKVCSSSEAPQFFADGGIPYPSQWVKVDDPMGQDPKRRTWRQLLEKLPEASRPQVYVARAGEVGVAQMFKRSDAMAAAAELGHKFAQLEVKAEQRDAKEKKKNTAAKVDKRAKLEVVAEVGERIAAKVQAQGVTVRDLRWFAAAYLATRNVERVLERRELSEPELEKWIESKANVKELAGFLAECVADQLGAGTSDDFPDDFRDMATSYQIDVDRLEQLRLQRKEEKKTAREAKKGAKP